MKKKLVVIGGGFAGSNVAKKLQKKFDVVLFDTKNYFEFTPSILRTIIEPQHISKIQVLHSHYLRYARFILGKVTNIDNKFVYCGKKKTGYDYLVIASGSSYELPFKEQGVVDITRAEHLKSCYSNLCKSKKIVIVGGGLVGVELAGEICSKYNDKDITIVHSGESLIPRNSKKSISYATRYLEKKRVKVIYNKKVVSKKGKFCFLDDGTKIEADMVFLCTGIKPNYDLMKSNYKNCLDERNQIKVNNYLQLERENNIFAIGDVNFIKEEKTAQNAERQSELVIHNLNALEENKELEEYQSKKTPLVISLGRWKGIFEYGNFTFRGLIPGLMKRLIEKKEMWKKRRI